MFALVAMTFSFVETAWASTCAPVATESSPSADADQSPGQDCLLGTLHDREGEPSDDDERHCPFAPAAAQACTGVASLPAQTVVGVAPSVQSATAVFAEPTQHGLHLGKALFRPPRT